ncbi:MAG: SH3 domain-containing protein [Eubacteriales bacterium]|nr:SH3 domain-containing protein [Eubacteriales bacterium]
MRIRSLEKNLQKDGKMKRKSLYILAIAVCLSVMPACGQQTETAAVVAEAETFSETESSAEEETLIREETAPVEETEEPESIEPETVTEEAGETELYTIEPMEKVMYTTTACNIRQMPTTESEIIGGAGYGAEITVTGKTTYNGKDWYKVSVTGAEEEFISASLLSDSKPVPQSAQGMSDDQSDIVVTQYGVGRRTADGIVYTDPETGKTSVDNSPAAMNPESIPEHKSGEVIGTITFDDGTTVTASWGTELEDRTSASLFGD